jgi:SpoVK/Ycf46/Vps4 family AAA+-type ATPase
MQSFLSTNHQMQSFLTAHPREDGWKIYHCCTPLVRNLYLQFLLDYLRDEHPEAIKACAVAKEPTQEEMQEAKGQSHAAAPDSDWDLQKSLDAAGWVGSLEIEWAECLIHVCSLFTDPCLNKEPLVLIATTSNVALRNLLNHLSVFGEAREKRGNREILVVNGEDIAVPTAGWDDVILQPGAAEEIRGNVEAFFRSRDKYQELHIPHRRGMLFAGPPGCGKTLTLRVLASTVQAKFITVLGRVDVDDRAIERAFYLAEKYAPSVLVFEELDKLVESQGVSLSYFLSLVDGLKVNDGVLLIATSNEPGKLDPALLHRPSRFDRVWKFPLPRQEQRVALLRKLGEKYFSQAALEEAARKSNGFSMAYVQEIVVNAILYNAHDGNPDDGTLLRSLETLRLQRKAASKDDETVADRESVGFCLQEKGTHGTVI